MKKSILTCLLLSLALAATATVSPLFASFVQSGTPQCFAPHVRDDSTKDKVVIHVISDPHVLAPEYIPQHGNLKTSEMIVPLSPDLLTAAIDSVISRHSDMENTYLLITGDMTLNGEDGSHRFVAHQLQRLHDFGICTLVIPGNHDLYNSWASLARHSDGIPAQAIDRETFRQIYDKCGYSDADAVMGLSYVRRLGQHLAIICLDDALDDGGKTYYSDGALDNATIEWMKQQADVLRSEGRVVIAAVHHHVIPHHRHEASLASSRMLNATPGNNYGITNDQIQLALADAGISYILTGHYHAHDVQRATILDTQGQPHTITDIATGALASGGNYMRTLICHAADERIEVSSTRINVARDESVLKRRGVTDWYSGQSFRQYADSCFHVGNDALVYNQIKQEVGSLADFAKVIVEPLSVAIDRYFMGEDGTGGEIPFDEDDVWMLDALKQGKPQLYEIIDSMSRNYADDPNCITPDLNLTLVKGEPK